MQETVRLTTIVNSPGYKRVAEVLEEEILKGRMLPGAYLPSELELASQLGVNRSTVREGIRSLENSGLVRRVGAKRLIVTVPTNQDINRATSRALVLRKTTFLELWEIQMELEPFSAELAAKRIEPDVLAKIEENVAEMERVIEDDKAIIALDVTFHRLVAEATSNVALQIVTEPIGFMLFEATASLYRDVPQSRHRLLTAHKNILTALAEGNAESARLWMEKHIRDFRVGYSLSGLMLDAVV